MKKMKLYAILFKDKKKPKLPSMFLTLSDYEPIYNHRFSVELETPAFEVDGFLVHSFQKKNGDNFELTLSAHIVINEIYEKMIPGFEFNLKVDLLDPTGISIMEYLPITRVVVVNKIDPILSRNDDSIFTYTLILKKVKPKNKIQKLIQNLKMLVCNGFAPLSKSLV